MNIDQFFVNIYENTDDRKKNLFTNTNKQEGKKKQFRLGRTISDR